MYEALVLGTRDYVTKNGFSDVVIGLSGGIDSSLVAAIAADALGPEHGARRAHALALLAATTRSTDAERLADALGIDHRTIPIEPAHDADAARCWPPSFEGREPDLTEENLQSRIRGMVLMALSQQVRLAGADHRATRARARSATPPSTATPPAASPSSRTCPSCWSTSCAGTATSVAGRELIPEAVLTKPPSAELRPDQRDDQSLPPYEVLDPILEAYVEHDRTVDEIVAAGFDRATVERIVRARRPGRVQAPPVTPPGPAHHEGLRQGPPPPHHQPLPRLTRASAACSTTSASTCRGLDGVATGRRR